MRDRASSPKKVGAPRADLERGRAAGVERVRPCQRSGFNRGQHRHALKNLVREAVEVVGREAEAEHWPELPIRAVTPGYFAVTRVPHLRGRLPATTDSSTSGRVVVINEALAG